MRKKLPPGEKRNRIIGIKVKDETRQKLEYIAGREGKTLSTYIDVVLNLNIENYFKENKIDWENMSPEQRKGGE